MNRFGTGIRSRGLVIVLAALVTASPAFGLTDLEKFQKRVGKSAPYDLGFPERPKVTCMCTSSPHEGQVGVLTQYVSGGQFVALSCAIPIFNSGDGHYAGFNYCIGSANFIPLPK
jgi:hypothetical protein